MKLEKPLVTVRHAPNYPDVVEVELVWPGEYKTMMSFHMSDFSDGRAEKMIEEHVKRVKRFIDLFWFKEQALKLELEKAKYVAKLFSEEELIKATRSHDDKVH